MMFNQFLSDTKLTALLDRHATQIVEYLLSSRYEFGVVANLDTISFDPPLPEEILSKIAPTTFLMLAGYSLESASLEGDYLIFEAGFGPDNFGSVVSVHSSTIIQIIVDELSLFVNLYAGQKHGLPNEKPEPEMIPSGDAERSRNVFLSNPENKKFLK